LLIVSANAFLGKTRPSSNSWSREFFVLIANVYQGAPGAGMAF